MRQTIIEALTWALRLDPATLKWPAAVLVALCFGLVLFGLVQYQAFNRLWGIHLVLGLAGGAVVVGLGAASHWLLGVLYGLGYVLTWLAWVLTRHWHWWRQALARGLVAGLTIGPWLWLGAAERVMLNWNVSPAMAKWLMAPNGVIWFWMLLGFLWLLVLVGGWGCWRWPAVRPGRRRLLVAAWAVLGVLGLNWYAAGRVDLSPAGSPTRSAPSLNSEYCRFGYVLVSRPGSQWYRGVYGNTLLHWAAFVGYPTTLRLLLAVGADAKATDVSAGTPLHYAAQNGNAEVTGLLLAAGADVHAQESFGRTPLHMAALRGQAEAIRILLAAGAEANAKANDGSTPLHDAASTGHAEAIRLLLAAGARVNEWDHQGPTALDVASNDECRVLLRQVGAMTRMDLAAGRTPLHQAAGFERTEALRLLLAAGADAEAKDIDGLTPLHVAATSGRAEAIRLLLGAGAKVNEQDRGGKTALDQAYNDACREVLRQAGGKTGAELDAEKAKPAPPGAGLPAAPGK